MTTNNGVIVRILSGVTGTLVVAAIIGGWSINERLARAEEQLKAIPKLETEVRQLDQTADRLRIAVERLIVLQEKQVKADEEG